MLYRIGISAIVVCCASSAIAYERVHLRSLQHGPIGDGIGFTQFDRTDLEITFGQERYVGRAESEGVTLTGVGTHYRTDLGVGYRLSDMASFVSFARLHFWEKDFAANASDYSYIASGADYELGAGPHITIGHVAFGGSVSVMIFDEDDRQIQLGEDTTDHVISQAVAPFVRFFGAFRTSDFVLGLSARVFNQARTTKTVTDVLGDKIDYTVARSLPGEVAVDAHLHATPNLEFSANMTARTYQQTDSRLHADTEGLNTSSPIGRSDSPDRNGTQISLRVGGAYQANERFSLQSSLSVEQPIYSKPEYASLIHENLGGYGIHVGSTLTQDDLDINFGFGYRIPLATSYDVSQAAATPWADVGERVRIEQPRWNFELGLIARL